MEREGAGERATLVAFCMMACCFLAGLAAAAEYRCYDCASLLSPESSCDTGPNFNSSTICKTYCYTDVTTHAGVRSGIKRGCTSELECSEESTCRELSRSGPCRSCCKANLCNDDSPDDLGFVSTWEDPRDDAAGTGASGAAAPGVLGGGHGRRLPSVGATAVASLLCAAFLTNQ